MNPATVVRIRILPADVMTGIDLCHAAGINTERMALASVMRLAFAVAMQAFRTQGVAPERDGFEYNEMVSRYKTENRSTKSATGRNLSITLKQNEAGDLKVPTPQNFTALDRDMLPNHLLTQAERLARTEDREIRQRTEIDPLNLSEQDMEHLRKQGVTVTKEEFIAMARAREAGSTGVT